MIKVVLDANIFVSSLLKLHSKPAQIIELVEKGEVILVISPAIISEIKRVLLYPKIVTLHHRSSDWIDTFIEELTKKATLTSGKLDITAIKDDPDDDKYLECAVEGAVDYIISGDKHLKNLKSFQGIKIIEPAMFLKIVK